MNLDIERSPRKHLASRGLIYMGEEEWEVIIKDISLTGVRAELKCDPTSTEVKDIFNMLSASTVVDLYLPEMRLAGEAEVIRVDMLDDHIQVAFEFKSVSFDMDNRLCRRKVYRKNLTAPGKIQLNGEYHAFKTIDVSVEGLMINIAASIVVEPGVVALFEFERLGLDGEVKVVWVEQTADAETLIGLEYVHMGKTAIKGIPRFARPRANQ